MDKTGFMKLFLSAFLLAVALEGAMLALFPEFMRNGFRKMAEAEISELRGSGVFALMAAVILAWLAKHLF